MLGGANGRSPDLDFPDAERHPCVRRLTQASSLLRRGSRFDSPIAARGERRERAVRPATEPMRSSEGSIQVDESSRCERPYSHAHGKHARYLGATSCPPDHTCGHPLPRVCPKGRLNGAYRLMVHVCHAFCSRVQATSTDLLFGAGGAPGRLRYDRVSTWCSLAGLSLGLLGSRAPRHDLQCRSASSYRGHFSASPATKERSLKLASTATDS